MRFIGTTTTMGTAETQFDVEVLDNIKGEAKGNVTVNQFGGKVENINYVYDNETMLESGKTYLLAAKYLLEKNWYTIVIVDGHEEIKNDDHKKEITTKFKSIMEKYNKQKGT